MRSTTDINKERKKTSFYNSKILSLVIFYKVTLLPFQRYLRVIYLLIYEISAFLSFMYKLTYIERFESFNLTGYMAAIWTDKLNNTKIEL